MSLIGITQDQTPPPESKGPQYAMEAAQIGAQLGSSYLNYKSNMAQVAQRKLATDPTAQAAALKQGQQALAQQSSDIQQTYGPVITSALDKLATSGEG